MRREQHHDRFRSCRSVGKTYLNVDVSDILRRDITTSDSGDAPIEMILRTASHRLTALTKLSPNAEPTLSLVA
jgi:hypothetical protein